jgi:ribonucleoside-diphosphate reductase alpha chain
MDLLKEIIMTINDLIVRKFTKELNDSDKSVYDMFQWKTIDVYMENYKTGETLLDMKNLEFPAHYSTNACNIIAGKYFRKAGIEGEKYPYEYSMKQVVDRLVSFWVNALKKEKMLESEEKANILYDELAYSLLSQMWAPNSPQWFNTGLEIKYGIKGEPDDLYYFDDTINTVVESSDKYTRTQASACFILSIEDKLLGENSITDHYVSETKLFKGGSGVGTNFSCIRGVDEALSSGGHSSGLMSFLVGLDKNAGAIKSGGTTRRAAKMVIVDIDHPEIDSFIDWKVNEEHKVKALGKMGYDTSIDGEAYSTVSGQNSNNSVRLNSSFLNKVENFNNEPDIKIELTGRVDNKVNREIEAKKLWDKINQASWECADPGVQFDNSFNAWHTCPYGEDGFYNAKHNRINATNPCSEYAFLDNTACNLASINIYTFYDFKNNSFNIDEYIHLISLIQLVLEASIFHGQFPTEEVARKSYMFRTTGLGLANIASLLLAIGYPYDSAKSRNLTAALAGILTGCSYYTSALMAEKVGPFEKYDINKKSFEKVIRNHARVAGLLTDDFEDLPYDPIQINHTMLNDGPFKNISQNLLNCWDNALKKGEKFGYRNAQVSVIAPTGTISFAMDCGSTSVEPFYSHIIFKKLVGGGSMEIVNPVLDTALANLGYKTDEINDIINYLLEKNEDGIFIHSDIKTAPHIKNEHIEIFNTANEISPEGHVLMVSAITPMISGSVSKTVNLPNEATVNDIEKIHLLAYKTGSKAIAVYRDGCKAAQPLSSKNTEKSEKLLTDFTYNELIEIIKSKQLLDQPNERNRPLGIRMSRTHAAKIGDIELYITVGFYDSGKMSEVFVSTDKEGTVVKGLLASLSKSISNMLQFKIPPDKISKMLQGQQYEPSGFVDRHPYIKYASSISDLISKVIDIEHGDFSKCQVKPESFALVNQLHVRDIIQSDNSYNSSTENYEILYDSTCAHCGSTRMVKNGTCKVCLDCGSTTGCS